MRAATRVRRIEPEPALTRLREVLLAIPASEVVQLNVEVRRAVETITKTLPRVRDLELAIVTEMPTFDVTLFDKLLDYVNALSQAHAACLTTGVSPLRLPQTFESAKKMRKMLLTDACSLAQHGLVDRALLSRKSHANGWANVANDLELLACGLHRAGPSIQGRCPLVLADLDAALRLAAQLREGAGAAAHPLPGRAEAHDLRDRAFTLTLRAYREIRRTLDYLRWREGDAEVIAS